jgi:hypothetical protein
MIIYNVRAYIFINWSNLERNLKTGKKKNTMLPIYCQRAGDMLGMQAAGCPATESTGCGDAFVTANSRFVRRNKSF